MRQKLGDVPTVFLGYADAEVEQKLQEIRNFDPTGDWWTRERSDDELRDHIVAQINKSKEIKKECEGLGITYIETSKNFEFSINNAENTLINSSSLRGV